MGDHTKVHSKLLFENLLELQGRDLVGQHNFDPIFAISAALSLGDHASLQMGRDLGKYHFPVLSLRSVPHQGTPGHV